MSLIKRISPFIKSTNDTGFGSNANSQAGRFLNKDGSFNVIKKGAPLKQRVSIYYNMLTMPRWEFMLIIIIGFVFTNLLFSFFYLLLDEHELVGIVASTHAERFKEIFFFSAQTLTTVGYGRINPVGYVASVIASVEALTGFLLFAIATGLIYGRFSRPMAYLNFSTNALVSPFQGATAIMFRFVSYKNNHTLTDVEVKVTLGLTVMENDKPVFKFYQLPLERSRVDSLMMNWTIVHPIDEESPLFGLTKEDLEAADAEIYVLVRGFDDIFSNTVLARSSYTFREVIFNAKFIPMYHESEDNTTTVLELNKLNDFVNL